jgi:hypothetical protein
LVSLTSVLLIILLAFTSLEDWMWSQTQSPEL